MTDLTPADRAPATRDTRLSDTTRRTCPVHAALLPGCPHASPCDTYGRQ